MKTVQEINGAISDNVALMKRDGTLPRTYKLLAKKNKFLQEIIMYLETNPKLEFLQSERNRLSKLISSKEEQYDYWSRNICDKSLEVKKRKSTFDRELGITNLKRQLKTIKFILT
jgi:hypothetical protein